MRNERNESNRHSSASGEPEVARTSDKSLGAAGRKRPSSVYCGTPYKRPMSSSGRRLVEIMMMMMPILLRDKQCVHCVK
ncbi:jg8523 [Pararge aegeria aegeria]|uniref:Jg8523 protein n=1 Tax=Pararge aegeria aegeria TaxID=348720 RepID=A0A8S4RY81_9NEOP|nr:jg8523 [Pararge aegeria aegeria]